jgi:hypothetical protein
MLLLDETCKQLTFKDINGLVEQNVQLRSLVRNLSDQIESREMEFKVGQKISCLCSTCLFGKMVLFLENLFHTLPCTNCRKSLKWS